MKSPRVLDRLWVLVVHEAGARVFSRDNRRKPLVLHARIDRPIGRAKNRELTSDRSGHEESWAPSKQRHGFDQQVLPTEKNALRFARLLALRLNRACGLDEFDHLLIVAGPKLLGMIRRELGPAVTARLAGTLDENLGNLADEDVPSHLESFVARYERSRQLKRAA